MYVDPGIIGMVFLWILSGIGVIGAYLVPKKWKGIKRWLSRHRASETPPDE